MKLKEFIAYSNEETKNGRKSARVVVAIESCCIHQDCKDEVDAEVRAAAQNSMEFIARNAEDVVRHPMGKSATIVTGLA